MKFGLLHTKENYYLGNDDGPLQYDDERMARAAATIATEMFGCWIAARPLPESLIPTGKCQSKIDGTTALRRIERRAR